MTTPNAALNRAMEDTNATFIVSKILHLGVMLSQDYEMVEAVTEFVGELDEHHCKQLEVMGLDRILRLIDTGEEECEEIVSEFVRHCLDRHLLGFLCLIEVPEATKVSSTGTSISWGLRRLRWFYGESLEEIVPAADEWAQSLTKVKQ